MGFELSARTASSAQARTSPSAAPGNAGQSGTNAQPGTARQAFSIFNDWQNWGVQLQASPPLQTNPGQAV